MSYATIEAAALAVLRKHGDFDANNTSLADFRAIGAKGKARVAILRFLSHTEEDITLQWVKHTWQTSIDLYVPWRGQMDNWETQIQTERQKVIDTFMAWPRLDSTAGVTGSKILASTKEDAPDVHKTYRGTRMTLTTIETVAGGYND